MSLVIFDLGAADWGTETSINKLVERFQPDTIYAYDCNPVFAEKTWSVGRTTIVQRREAAWLYEGHVEFYGGGTRGYVDNSVQPTRGTTVPCVDISRMIQDVCDRGNRRIMVKLDVEGGEHLLLPHFIETGADKCLELLMVERHGGDDREWEELMMTLRCDVEPWV